MAALVQGCRTRGSPERKKMKRRERQGKTMWIEINTTRLHAFTLPVVKACDPSSSYYCVAILARH